MRDKRWFKFNTAKARVFLAFCGKKKNPKFRVWSHMPVIPALRRLRQEDLEEAT